MTLPWSVRSPKTKAALMGAVAVAYFALAVMGFKLALPGTNATAVWIPTGLAIAFVLRLGPGLWPGIFLGALAANCLQLGSLGLPLGTLTGVAVATAAGNTGEAILAGFLIERATGSRDPFNTGADTLQFVLYGAIFSTALSAGVGTASYCLATGRWDLFVAMGTTWWIGDAVGALVVVPLLTFSRTELTRLPPGTLRETLASAGLMLILAFGITHIGYSLAFLFLPLLAFAAVRLGPFYASALVVYLCAVVGLFAATGTGALIQGVSPQESLLIQQGFLGSLAITTSVLAVSFRARKRMEAQLLQRNRMYRTLSEVNQAIVHAEDRSALLEATCRILVEHGGFRMAWAEFKDPASGRLVLEASAALPEGFSKGLEERSMEGQDPGWIAVLENREVIFGDCWSDPGYAPWREAARALGYRTSCAFPIRQGGIVTGAILANHTEPDAIGVEEDALLVKLTGDLGFALKALETRQDLLESERRIQSIMEYVELLTLTLGTDGTITFCNNFMLRVTGWRREELLGHSCFERLLPPEAHPPVRALLQAGLKDEGIALHQENEILTRDGARRLVLWNNIVLRDRAGVPVGIASLGEDITDRKASEEALSQRAYQLATLNSLGTHLNATLNLAAMGRAALVGLIEAVSPDMALFFRCEGGSVRLLDHLATGDFCHANHAKASDIGEPWCALAAQDGRAHYARDTGDDSAWSEAGFADLGVKSFAALPLVRGETILGVLGLASSSPRNFQAQASFLETLAAQIAAGLQNALLLQRLQDHTVTLEQRVEERTTQLREANEDLAKAVEQAQAADVAKSAFLATMSHELRTPLNSIIGFTGILLQGLVGPLNEEQTKQLGMVRASSNHLLDLINDVLDISKIEAGQLEVSLQPFDLGDCLEKCLLGVRPLADKRGIALDLHLAEGTGLIRSDRRRVEQVFLNLLSNAIKFTEQGGVTVTTLLTEHEVEVLVKDTGIGIRAEDLEKLFHPFRQVDSGLTRKYDGTGLGLSISKRIIELLGGRIWVESEPGRGSLFAFSLPREG